MFFSFIACENTTNQICNIWSNIYIYIYKIFLWTSKGDQIIKYGRLWSNLNWCPRALLDLISPSRSWSLHYTKKWFVYQIKELKKIFIFLQNNTSLSYTDEDFFSISFLFFCPVFFFTTWKVWFPTQYALNVWGNTYVLW